VSLLRPSIIRDLKLPEHGLEMIPLETSFTPLVGDPGLCRWADPERSRREIARFSTHDSEIYPEFSLTMTKVAQFVREIIDSPAPDPTSWNPRELMKLLRLGQTMKKGGTDAINMNLKLMTMSAAPMAVSGIIGTYLGVKSPGTAYVLLHHYMGEIDGAFRSWGYSKGGTGGLSMACARAAESHGVEIRTEASVAEISIKNGRARGVLLANGEEIEAKTVLSSCDPNLTFLRLVGERHFDEEFTTQIKRYKLRGSSGKVNLAVDRLPEFFGREGTAHLRGDIAIAPGIDYLERAYDEAKYGEFSSRPYINVVIPSIMDPSVAPPGKHIISMFVQYAPYEINGGPETWPGPLETRWSTPWPNTVPGSRSRFCSGRY